MSAAPLASNDVVRGPARLVEGRRFDRTPKAGVLSTVQAIVRHIFRRTDRTGRVAGPFTRF